MGKNKLFLTSILILFFVSGGVQLGPAGCCLYDYLTRRIKDNEVILKNKLRETLILAKNEGKLNSTPDPTGEITYKNILRWLEDDYGESWRQIKELVDSGNWEELKDAFYTDLSFGTAGMRGKIGVGPNRINEYTVKRAGEALARYLLTPGINPEGKPFLISYDTRDGSRKYAELIAGILTAHNIKVVMSSSDKNVGWVSHLLPRLSVAGGVMITASHNPTGYNGIKVSASYGAQLMPEPTQIITDAYKSVNLGEVKAIPLEEAKARGLLVFLGEELDSLYLNSIVEHGRDERVTPSMQSLLKITLDPLYGGNRVFGPQAIKALGYDYQIVDEHAQEDPNFTGLRGPDPRLPGSPDLAIKLAGGGEWRMLTGDEIAILLAYYYLDKLRSQGALPNNGVSVKNHATTNMLRAINYLFGVGTIDVAVGFKYIGDKAHQYNDQEGGKDKVVLYGAEFADGFAIMPHSYEKDGVMSSVLFLQALALWNQELGRNSPEEVIILWDSDGDRFVPLVRPDSVVFKKLEAIEKELFARSQAGLLPEGLHPFYRNTGWAIEVKGIQARQTIERILSVLGNLKAGEVFGEGCVVRNIITEVDGVKDGIRVIFTDGSSFLVRASGTEPKLRIYIEAVSNESAEAAKERLNQLHQVIDSWINRVRMAG